MSAKTISKGRKGLKQAAAIWLRIVKIRSYNAPSQYRGEEVDLGWLPEFFNYWTLFKGSRLTVNGDKAVLRFHRFTWLEFDLAPEAQS